MVGEKPESSLEPSVFLLAMPNAPQILAATSARARATTATVGNHSVGCMATTCARPCASAAATTTCNGFRRVDGVGCELIKY